jgi:hypothetical protein
MAQITRKTNPSPAKGYNLPNNLGSGLKAGEALVAGDVVYIKASDRRVYKSGGSGYTALTDAIADVDGMVFSDAAAGDAVSVHRNLDVAYAAKGGFSGTQKKLYLSNSVAGGLADAAGVVGARPIATVVGDGLAPGSETDGGTIFFFGGYQS